MTSPSVVDRTSTTVSTASTTHNINMPATVTARNLLLMILDMTSPGTITDPGGWTKLSQAGTNASLSVYGKISDGSEGGTTVNVATTNSCKAAAYCVQVNNWGGTIANDVAVGTTATGFSSNPNPPSTSWSWGALDNLIIACAGRQANNNSSAAPSGYSNLNGVASTGGSDASVDIADLSGTADASPENPGTFTAGLTSWSAQTIVIRGAYSLVAPHRLKYTSRLRR